MCRRGAVRGLIFCIPCVDRGACDHTANSTQSEEPRPPHPPPAPASNQTSLRRRNWCQDAFTHIYRHTAGYCISLWQLMAYCWGFYLHQSETMYNFILPLVDDGNSLPEDRSNIPARLGLHIWFIVTLLYIYFI